MDHSFWIFLLNFNIFTSDLVPLERLRHNVRKNLRNLAGFYPVKCNFFFRFVVYDHFIFLTKLSKFLKE